MFTFGLEDGVEHLGKPAFFAKNQVILQAHFGGVLLGDVGAAEQNVPKEQQVAEVAFVVANAVLVGQCMVRPMGGGGGNGPLNHPHHGAQSLDFVQGRVPGHGAMRAHDDGELDDQVDQIDIAKAKVDQHTRNPQAGHHQVIEKVISVGHAHAHVVRGVVRTV